MKINFFEESAECVITIGAHKIHFGGWATTPSRIVNYEMNAYAQAKAPLSHFLYKNVWLSMEFKKESKTLQSCDLKHAIDTLWL